MNKYPLQAYRQPMLVRAGLVVHVSDKRHEIIHGEMQQYRQYNKTYEYDNSLFYALLHLIIH